MNAKATVEVRPLTVGDLTRRAQVHDLVVDFYREIVFDDVLAPVFDEVAEVDWSAHIPRLIDYWCRILFGTMEYAGAVTAAHRHLHHREAIRTEQCDRWYELWIAAVDRAGVGPNAQHAKAHAATLMAGMARRIFGYEWTPATGAPNVR